MRTKKGFTLIELLVVIAIIGLLMSVLVPALRKVKQQATGVVCLANLKGLIGSWHAYAVDNDDVMVFGHVPNTFVADHKTYGFWVDVPQTRDGLTAKGATADVTPEYEEYGIMNGKLYPYVDSVDAYHCPGDRSFKLFANTNGSWINSYSITGMMNGEEAFRDNLDAAKKTTDIVSPGNKCVMFENVDDRGWLMGSWLMSDYKDPDTPEWTDPIAVWHKDRGSIGFADGHAETHQWVDSSTIANAEAGRVVQQPWSTTGDTGEDVLFMRDAYVAGRK